MFFFHFFRQFLCFVEHGNFFGFHVGTFFFLLFRFLFTFHQTLFSYLKLSTHDFSVRQTHTFSTVFLYDIRIAKCLSLLR